MFNPHQVSTCHYRWVLALPHSTRPPRTLARQRIWRRCVDITSTLPADKDDTVDFLESRARHKPFANSYNAEQAYAAATDLIAVAYGVPRAKAEEVVNSLAVFVQPAPEKASEFEALGFAAHLYGMFDTAMWSAYAILHPDTVDSMAFSDRRCFAGRIVLDDELAALKVCMFFLLVKLCLVPSFGS